MPSRKGRVRLAPLARGVSSETVPALKLLLKPPPLGCEGGCSRVVPWTVIEHGAPCPAAAHVAESLMESTIAVEVLGRRSANPDGAGKVVRSITRKRNRVTGEPVLFTNLRRMSRGPKVERA